MKSYILASLVLVPGAFASPLLGTETTPLHKRMDITGCTDPEKAQIQQALTDLSGLAAFALETIKGNGDGWKTNKGYTHYFTEDDHDAVANAFTAGVNGAVAPGTAVKYNIVCAKPGPCSSGSFAVTEAPPEDFEGGGFKKGTRILNICPLFFTDPRTQRTLPGDDATKKAEYCKLKESKKLSDFESGAHTLLHEMSHLDTFGVAAQFPEATQPAAGDTPEFTYHGTIDWRNKGDAGNARTLKGSKAKNRPQNYQNAESLAAAASEIYAMKACDLTDIPV